MLVCVNLRNSFGRQYGVEQPRDLVEWVGIRFSWDDPSDFAKPASLDLWRTSKTTLSQDMTGRNIGDEQTLAGVTFPEWIT